jgi:hypothetical protein
MPPSSRTAPRRRRQAGGPAGSLTDAEREHIIAESAALKRISNCRRILEVLPRIRPGDVSALPRPALPIPPAVDGAVAFSIASNGISYANVLYDVSGLPEAAWPWLRLYTDLAPELGVGDMSFDDASAWRQSMVPRSTSAWKPSPARNRRCAWNCRSRPAACAKNTRRLPPCCRRGSPSPASMKKSAWPS